MYFWAFQTPAEISKQICRKLSLTFRNETKFEKNAVKEYLKLTEIFSTFFHKIKVTNDIGWSGEHRNKFKILEK